ncbi:hypothetical protein Syun_025248 [Stephania yunnanensis]|uniref:Phytocyanin domain-containing protein n=1 Tax=Stephania yunnanensis TaxID=152371 RepID=A0AAP0HR26_9MAGN
MASSRALQHSIVTMFFLFCSFIEARELLVGGNTDSWKVPSSQSESLNQWAQRSRFIIGDTLVWKYSSDDSVLQVTRKDYLNCDVSSPIAEYRDGNAKIALTRSGPHYFISGADGHCEKGQKMIVVVLSEKHMFFRSSIVALAPSPMELEGPAMAPTSGVAGLGKKEFGVSLMVVLSIVAFVLM